MEENLLGERLKLLIELRGETYTTVAKNAGVSQGGISELCNGDKKNVRSDVLRKLCLYFGVSADYLLGITDARTTDTELRVVCDYLKMPDEAVIFMRELTDDLREELIYLLSYNNAHPTTNTAPLFFKLLLGYLTKYRGELAEHEIKKLELCNSEQVFQYSEMLDAIKDTDILRYRMQRALENILDNIEGNTKMSAHNILEG